MCFVELLPGVYNKKIRWKIVTKENLKNNYEFFKIYVNQITENKIMKKIYIITGANGFLGNNIARKLEKYQDSEIRAFVLPNDKTKALNGLNCKIYYGDVTKKETLNDIFEAEENAEMIVIHCAALVYIKTKPNPEVLILT